MFPTSTQRRHWMFDSDEAVLKAREDVHEQFIAKHGGHITDATQLDQHFLTMDEVNYVLRVHEIKLMEFCNKFKPPMPKSVMGTAGQYFKRFYLNNSVMDYHPKEILVTAAYLACKVEEFNVSIEQFIANIKGNKARAMDIVLNNELLLMKELQFHLTVHNPYRPVEGLLIDIKTRYRNLKVDAEIFRRDIESFLDDALITNVALLYAPSQIALAAIIHAAAKKSEGVDSYVTDILFGGNISNPNLKSIVGAVRKIRVAVKTLSLSFDVSRTKAINEKLERCRNQDNNPDSQSYKRKRQEELEDDEDRRAKIPKMQEEEAGVKPLA